MEIKLTPKEKDICNLMLKDSTFKELIEHSQTTTMNIGQHLQNIEEKGFTVFVVTVPRRKRR